jgi:hypothetical protein
MVRIASVHVEKKNNCSCRSRARIWSHPQLMQTEAVA